MTSPRTPTRRTSTRRTSTRQPVLLAVGVVLVLLGALWTGQGLGWIGGSSMTGVTFWAVVGPIVALVGLALLWRGLRRAS